jgi:hypothetical protein
MNQPSQDRRLSIDERVDQVLQAYAPLQEAAMADSRITFLLKTAAGQERGDIRWRLYEHMKQVGVNLVGLGSPAQYEAFCKALDDLLPLPPSDLDRAHVRREYED